MKRPPSVRPVGRPRDPTKAKAILDAGWGLFLEQGVEGTSIEAIAAKAGVSKVTLYTYFLDRTALFEAAVLREMEQIEKAQALSPLDGLANIVDQLRIFGVGIMSFLASKPAIDFYSVVAGELRRHDQLARTFYISGPGRTRDNLAALLSAGVQRGELTSLVPHEAADELFGLWQGFTNFQFSLGIDINVLRGEIAPRVERGIRVFMLAYGAHTRSSL